jgi:hypothetical protein
MRLMSGAPAAWLVSLALAAPTSAGATEDPQQVLARFAGLFEGEFDNFQQVWEEREARSEAPHEHIHSIFARVTLPAFGGHVFYVQQYEGGDPTRIYRQRLYSFAADAGAAAIRLTIYSFPDEQAVRDAHLDPTRLAGLVPAMLRTTPGCEVDWKPEGAAFVGTMKDKACRVVSRRSGQTLVISDDLRLDASEIWIRDQASDEAGRYVFGHKGNVHHKLKRCRFFDGWASLRRDGSSDQHEVVRGLRLHDQGQRVEVSAGGATYELELAQLVYQASKTAILKLAVYEKGQAKAVSYAWTDPTAERIGLNLRFVETGFRRSTDRLAAGPGEAGPL